MTAQTPRGKKQYFRDTATGIVYAFSAKAKAVQTKGIYSFANARGKPLNLPKTLQPCAAPAQATPAIPTAAQLLSIAKAKQIAILTNQARNIIMRGFKSSALGAPHDYASTIAAQVNLDAAASVASRAAAGWSTPEWCKQAAGSWNFQQHSGAQIVQVQTDCQAFIAATRTKLAALNAAVTSESTIAAVEAITW